MLTVDNAVFEVGYKWEMEFQIEMERLKAEHDNTMWKALIGAMYAGR